MVNTSSNVTSLTIARALVRDLNCATLTETDIALLHEIANFACANAQEARFVQAADIATVEWFEERERYAHDALAACGK
jgi:hypothetical protein